MPELPEVETTRRGIMSHVVGKTVSAVFVHESRLRWPVSPELAQMVTGQTILDIKRRGKYLLFELETGRVMIHLGMSGSLRLARAHTERRKHDHLEFIIDNGSTLRFHDPRRFGSVFWLYGDAGHELIDTLGPERRADAGDQLRGQLGISHDVDHLVEGETAPGPTATEQSRHLELRDSGP